METITQCTRRIQTDISEAAHERLRIKAAKDETSIGAAISDVAIKYLPPAPNERALAED